MAGQIDTSCAGESLPNGCGQGGRAAGEPGSEHGEKTDPSNLAAWLILAALMVVWGCAFPFMVYLLGNGADEPALLPPITHFTVRHVMASLALLPLLLYRVRRHGWPGMKGIARFTVLGSLGMLGYHIPLMYGLYLGASGPVAALIVICSPVVVALLGGAVLGERTRTWQWAGIATAMCGAAAVILIKDGARTCEAASGAFVIMLCPVFWGLYTVLLRRETRTFKPLDLAAWHMLTATLVSVPFVLLIEPHGLEHVARLPAFGWAALAYLGLLSSAAGLLVWCWTLERLTAANVSMSVYAVPVVAASATWIFCGQEPTAGMYVGGALIFCGMYLIQRYRAPGEMPGAPGKVPGKKPG